MKENLELKAQAACSYTYLYSSSILFNFRGEAGLNFIEKTIIDEHVLFHSFHNKARSIFAQLEHRVVDAQIVRPFANFFKQLVDHNERACATLTRAVNKLQGYSIGDILRKIAYMGMS